ncbi:MAG: sigma-70 family RNA polymerase sigma factor [Pseudomonadota bacterium]
MSTIDRKTPVGDPRIEQDASDETLVRRIAAERDKSAFELLFNRYAGRIKGVLIKAGAAPDEADEATQEAMLAIWRKASTFDPARASVGAWVFAIARNRRIDQIRRRKRPEPDPNDPLFQPDPPAPPEAEVAVAARDARLREAVAALTDAQREVVHLAFFIGLSHPEIAARTGAPLGTVKSRLRLAGDRLRTALGADFWRELFDD